MAGPGELAAFTGSAGAVGRVATTGETLLQGEAIGRFPTSAVAAAGPNGAVTFATISQNEGESNAIYCRCPQPAR